MFGSLRFIYTYMRSIQHRLYVCLFRLLLCDCVRVCAYTKRNRMLKPRFSFIAPFVSLFPIAALNAISFACVLWITFGCSDVQIYEKTQRTHRHFVWESVYMRWLIQFMFFERAMCAFQRTCVHSCMIDCTTSHFDSVKPKERKSITKPYDACFSRSTLNVGIFNTAVATDVVFVLYTFAFRSSRIGWMYGYFSVIISI